MMHTTCYFSHPSETILDCGQLWSMYVFPAHFQSKEQTPSWLLNLCQPGSCRANECKVQKAEQDLLHGVCIGRREHFKTAKQVCAEINPVASMELASFLGIYRIVAKWGCIKNSNVQLLSTDLSKTVGGTTLVKFCNQILQNCQSLTDLISFICMGYFMVDHV